MLSISWIFVFHLKRVAQWGNFTSNTSNNLQTLSYWTRERMLWWWPVIIIPTNCFSRGGVSCKPQQFSDPLPAWLTSLLAKGYHSFPALFITFFSFLSPPDKSASLTFLSISLHNISAATPLLDILLPLTLESLNISSTLARSDISSSQSLSQVASISSTSACIPPSARPLSNCELSHWPCDVS